MKNKILFIIKFLIFLFFSNPIFSENLSIQSEIINIDKNKQVTIFQNNVVFKTQDNKTIKSEYAEYDKLNKLIKLKDKITLIDERNNIIETEYAEYYENKKQFKSAGPTIIKTFNGYFVDGKDIILDKNRAFSKEKTIIKDLDNNIISLENFEFLSDKNIFKSIGQITIKDKKNNLYEFSQIYIDTKKKEILGTDIKAFINDENFKISPLNKPRLFANTTKINEQKSVYTKSIFTMCDYRESDKCPPWSIQSSKILHDNKKKTIYYDNALIKVYDIPVFYLPKLSHPDPTVERRSGFLPPSFTDTKNLGSSVYIPYFFALGNDKNFTLTSRVFAKENPLFLGEYHQAFKNSNLFADFGYTEGYNKTSVTKKPGQKSHFFSKLVKNFTGENNSNSELEINVQDVSNDKYLKLYKIESSLVDYNEDVLENSIDFTHSNEDIFFGYKSSIYESLNTSNDDKYEYILADAFLSKNLINNDKGSLDLQSKLDFRNYDTNKESKFFTNSFDWKSNNIQSNLGFSSNILGSLKNINYETKNIDIYKDDLTTEVYSAIGLLSDLKLQKEKNEFKHLFTPKFLLRFAPGSMRKETDGSRLNPSKAFSMNKADDANNFETGLSSTIGFDYKIMKKQTNFDFSVAQVINEIENKKMSSKSSLDEKLSDLVGSANYKLNDKISLKYDFSVDQNYNEMNYNDIGLDLNYEKINFNFNYLQEDKHIGDQEYFKTKINLSSGDNKTVSFDTKRNLITNSSEYYNLSYEYHNDCLRAGLVYRREFYNDSEIEPENSLMFKITLTPFGAIDSPTFSK